MRDVLAGLLPSASEAKDGPAHAGLAYERYAPEKGAGEQSLDRWEQWLSWVEKAREPEVYTVAFSRWKESLRQAPTAWFTARAEGRVLVGHGNASPTGVGLTLHSTWGVPVIPGSSLKGVLAGYVRAVFGEHAMEDVCRRLFGAPGVEGTQVGAQAGEVIFHDALWVSQRQEDGSKPAMLARDVLTVHQKDWYGGKEKVWPSDYDAPNPVAFLSVRPGSRFLVALSLAPGAGAEGERLLRWAAKRLAEALRDWGVGGKTAAGYGRLAAEGEPEVLQPRPAVRRSPVRDAFLAWASERKGKTPHKDILDAFETEWLGRLLELDPAGRQDCARELHGLMKKSPKYEARRDALLERLRG